MKLTRMHKVMINYAHERGVSTLDDKLKDQMIKLGLIEDGKLTPKAIAIVQKFK